MAIEFEIKFYQLICQFECTTSECDTFYYVKFIELIAYPIGLSSQIYATQKNKIEYDMCEHVLIMDICLFVLVRTVRQVNKQIIERFCLNFRLSVCFKRNVHTPTACVCLCTRNH